MRSIFIIIFITIFNLSSVCQENISFPMDVGNKFFYKAGHFPDNGYYAATKTITDTLGDGTRVVLVNKYYNNSTNATTEYWLFSNKKLYTASSPNSFNLPVFNGYFLNDTCLIEQQSICYAIFDSILLNQTYFCQSFSDIFQSPSYYSATHISTANNVGIYFTSYSAYSMHPPNDGVKDSIMLIGFTNGGILIGDSILTDISDNQNFIISSFNLYQNYPNPFNPETKIPFSVPTYSRIKLLVYDVIGKEIVTLLNEEKYPGYYTVNFNGMNYPSGIYFYRLITNSISITKKFILLK